MGADLSEEDLKNYKEAFGVVDKDATGEVARDDVVKVIRLLCLNPTPEEIAKLTDKASELSPEGGVDFDQFCEVTRVLGRTPADEKTELAAAFKVFDSSDDGTISREQLATVLKSKGADRLTDEEVEDMFAQVKGDGNISYDELVAILTT